MRESTYRIVTRAEKRASQANFQIATDWAPEPIVMRRSVNLKVTIILNLKTYLSDPIRVMK